MSAMCNEMNMGEPVICYPIVEVNPDEAEAILSVMAANTRHTIGWPVIWWPVPDGVRYWPIPSDAVNVLSASHPVRRWFVIRR